MNNDYHGVLHEPSLPKEIGPRYDSRSFSSPPSSVGKEGSHFCFFLSLFIIISFFLNRVSMVGTCPISLSLQLLRVVLSTKKYGSVRHKVLNAIVTAFSLDVFIFSVVFSCFNAFHVLWNDMECRHWSYVASFTLGYIHSRRILHGRGDFFP